jgi:uncharacterized membrane protein
MILGAKMGRIRTLETGNFGWVFIAAYFLLTAACLMAQTPSKVRVLYVGDSSVTLGAAGASSNFTYDQRGVAIENAAQKIIDAWRRNPRYDVTYMTGWDALAKFPETPEALKAFDVVILSDVDSDSIVLYPTERSNRAPMGPNRLKSIRDFVWQGGALVMIGGYATFVGRHNAGNWHGTPVEEALPVDCLAVDDDRAETPEGVTVEVKDPKHPITKGIEWSPSPVFNGYNRVSVKKAGKVLATFKETGDPLLVVWTFGKGRAMAFTSDIAPHWGAGFQEWKYYEQFWSQALDWLGSK